MQAKPGVLDHLSPILTIELTAINQYFMHAEMLRHWGFGRLHQVLRAYSIDQMQDAQRLIQHILYLEGLPNLQRLNDVQVGEHPAEHLRLDLETERHAVEALTAAITHCAQVGDYTTRHLLEERVRAAEARLDWLETQLDAIERLGHETYLAQQLTDG